MFSHPLPFRDAPTRLLFENYYQTALAQLQAQRPNVVVVAYSDQLRFLAALLASIEYKKLTVVADPHWQDLEWAALFRSVEVDWIFSDDPALKALNPDLQTLISKDPNDPTLHALVPKDSHQPALEALGPKDSNHPALQAPNPKDSNIPTLQPPISKGQKPDYTPWHSYILLPTGGSSGKLKLCIHSGENFRKSSQATAAFLGQEQLSSLSLLPPWHISGLMPFFRAYCTGGSFGIVDPRDLNPAQLPFLYEKRSKLESESVFTSFVPTLLKRVVETEELCEYFRGFRGIFVGGAPLLGPTLQAALDKGLPILPTYGSTETASMISLHPLDTPIPLKPGYSGKLLPHARIILPDTSFENGPDKALATPSNTPLGSTLENGPDKSSNKTSGTVLDQTFENTPDQTLAKTPEASFSLKLSCESLFYGYFPAKPENPDVFQTQDLARLDSTGQLYIEGRQDRIIISGGKKIDPLEVETALFHTHRIQDCIAFAIPHSEWGEALALAYIPQKREPSPQLYPQKLKDALKPLLASYKIPKAWYAVAALPFNDRGKCNAQALKQFIQSLPPPVYI